VNCATSTALQCLKKEAYYFSDKKMTYACLTSQIKDYARLLGFDDCRIVATQPAPHADFFQSWVAADRVGEMAYLARHVEKRVEPAHLAEPGAPPLRSLIVVAVNYYQFALPTHVREDPSRGLIASYAWGDDYHELIRPQLYALDAFIRSQTGRHTPGKCLVDTGPVLERDWAHQAGLGFTGKNCCTIQPDTGSWLLLATILVPEILDYDPPLVPVQTSVISSQTVLVGAPASQNYGTWHYQPAAEPGSTGEQQAAVVKPKPQLVTCGRCTRCLTACPTAAFVGPYHLDPLRCISYWTIEAQQPIPRALRSAFGNRIFGCDICQEVCPWNQRQPERTPRLAGLQAQSARVAPPLLEGFDPATPYWLEQAAFSSRFRRSPIKRAKRAGMLRNVAVALGNWADPQTIPALIQALHDPEPLPRGHAAWALGQVYYRQQSESAWLALLTALATEAHPWVREEIEAALLEDPLRHL
jgi:epoxyqueuosine reductase